MSSKSFCSRGLFIPCPCPCPSEDWLSMILPASRSLRCVLFAELDLRTLPGGSIPVEQDCSLDLIKSSSREHSLRLMTLSCRSRRPTLASGILLECRSRQCIVRARGLSKLSKYGPATGRIHFREHQKCSASFRAWSSHGPARRCVIPFDSPSSSVWSLFCSFCIPSGCSRSIVASRSSSRGTTAMMNLPTSSTQHPTCTHVLW